MFIENPCDCLHDCLYEQLSGIFSSAYDSIKRNEPRLELSCVHDSWLWLGYSDKKLCDVHAKCSTSVVISELWRLLGRCSYGWHGWPAAERSALYIIYQL